MAVTGSVLRKGPPAWLAFAAAGLVAVVTYRALPALGASAGSQSTAYLLITLAGAVALLVGVRRNRPRARAAWLFLAAGQCALFLGGLPPYLGPVLGLEPPPFPSTVSLIFFVQYPLTGIGLVLLIRRRAPSRDVPSLLDATIVTASATLLTWVYLVSPLTGDPSLTTGALVIIAAFPMGDLLILAVCARLLLGAGLRPPALWLLAGSLTLLAVGDTVQSVEMLYPDLRIGDTWPEMLWLCASVAIGAAGLHPSVQQVEERSPHPDAEAGRYRLVLLAVASLLAPATLLAQHLRGAPLHVPLVCATCALLFLLVLGRMAGLVAAQREVAVTDGLTGLYTRRYFEHSLAVEGERALRGAGMAVLLLDIDHFKAVNDTYGHHGGDRVLCEVARRLQHTMRGGDLVARYGGEEFAVLVPNTVPPIAREIAERVRLAIGAVPVPVDATTSVTVTVSIGIATMPEDAVSVDDLVLLADRLLYTAKESGRDRVASTVDRPREAPDDDPTRDDPTRDGPTRDDAARTVVQR